MVKLTVNGVALEVPENTTLLEAAKLAGTPVPSLCYWKGLNEIGACRVCVVEVEGIDKLVTACNNPVQEGMVVHTNSPRVRSARRTNLRLILSQHDCQCAFCVRSGNCELQKMAMEANLLYIPYPIDIRKSQWDRSAPLIRQESKCIKCMRCIQVCDKIQSLNIWDVAGTGSRVSVNVSHNRTIREADCAFCGQCVTHCPTAALRERDDTEPVLDALADPEITTVVQVAPAVRVAWAEQFGLTPGPETTGRMVTALKRLGFDYVFDTNFGADLTIMEEATELLERVKEGGVLPMFTSCSPGWIRYIEYYYPELIHNLSSCKSPMQMFGATVKTYWAQKEGIDPANIYVVGIMPCTAKKFEKTRDEESASGYPDVDAILTTRELAKMIRTSGILYTELPDSSFDDPLGEFTGAGVIFGATGGVMEAALRTAAETITGKPLDNIEFKEVRGIEGIKEAEYDLNGTKVKVAVASGLTNAKQLCDKIKSGECDYTFVEVMCCPGGCVNGGGQPIQSAYTRRQVDLRSARAKALYDEDAAATIRKSHENAAVQKLYKEFFHKPGSHKAHEILHTRYVDRKHKK